MMAARASSLSLRARSSHTCSGRGRLPRPAPLRPASHAPSSGYHGGRYTPTGCAGSRSRLPRPGQRMRVGTRGHTTASHTRTGPVSPLSAWSTTLSAAIMSGQHLRQMLPPVQHGLPGRGQSAAAGAALQWRAGNPPDAVVVGHVHIEHQLLLLGAEHAHRRLVRGLRDRSLHRVYAASLCAHWVVVEGP
jgi:hypothetical protein